MSMLDALVRPFDRAAGLATFAAVESATDPAPRRATLAAAAADDPLAALILRAQAERITRDEAMRIPAVRRAVHVIAGTISTFGLVSLDAATLARVDPQPPFLAQPDPQRTRQTFVHRLVEDLIWRDHSFARVERYAVGGGVKYLTRINPDRVFRLPNPDDVDALGRIQVDGQVPAYEVLDFDGAGLGGLERFGADILDLYYVLQSAAGVYAKAPTPKGVLKNSGDDLDDDEITALLNGWEAARAARSVAYLNDALTYEVPTAWSATELQLTEAREYAALEVARLFALPARAVNAPSNDSLTYSTDVMARRDILEALRPWMGVIEQTLSMNDRGGDTTAGIALPRGQVAAFDADAYVRDDPATRIAYEVAALNAGILTREEIRRREPLAWNS